MDEIRLLNKRYELKEILGSGAMSVIYKAHDRALERSVAVKLLREDFSRHSVFLNSFRQEAQSAAKLSHPNIVTVHDFGLDNGQLFLVMEFVPGTNLKAAIQQRGRFSVEHALPLMLQACAGIGYAHRAGLVHCDVKPQNMLVSPDMRLKVADFSISRALASIKQDERTHWILGSPQYFSPEQAAGAAPSPASDVYSLGIIFYEMLAGELPFQAKDASELARLHVEAQPPDIRVKAPEVTPELENVLSRVLAKQPAQRYQTADQLGRALINMVSLEKAPALTLTPETTPAHTGSVRVINRPRGNRSSGSVRIRSTGSVHTHKTTSHETISIEPPTPVIEPAFSIEPPTPASEPAINIDWLTVGLGLLALVAVLGLIPYWMWVYFVYNPPIR
jgi:serine/threonine protein kinase